MAKITYAQAMERITVAEQKAIFRVFGVMPKTETSVCKIRGFWYYFVNDFKFRIGRTNVRCRLFRLRFTDVPSTEYYISGLIEYKSEGNVGIGVSLNETRLKSPDDDATIERVLKKAIGKTFKHITIG